MQPTVGPKGLDRMNRNAPAEAMHFLRKALETNGFADLSRRVGSGQKRDEVETKFNGRARAAGGRDATVGHDALAVENGGEFAGHSRIGGVAPAGEQAAVVEDGGCGADGGEPAAGSVLGEDERADARVGAEERHAGAAGKEEEIEGGVGWERTEGHVGVGGDLAATGGVAVLGEGGDGDGDAGAAEKVNGGEGFDFLEAVEEEDEGAGHGEESVASSG